MKQYSFSFRDYAVHLFPGCLALSAVLYFYLDRDLITSSHAHILVFLLLIGGYLIGVFMDACTETMMKISSFKVFYWWVSGGDPIDEYFKGVRVNGDAYNINDFAAQALAEEYGEVFVRNQSFSELLYFMMRIIEAKNERSAAFISRINALENMSRNLAFSCFWVAVLFIVNCCVCLTQNAGSIAGSIVVSVCGLVMTIMLLRRRTSYRSWLAKSACRSFVALKESPCEITS